MYNIRGWKSSTAHSSDMPISNSVSNNMIEEDELDTGEENDITAPLPSDRLTSDKQRKPSPAKGISAKDKRRLREKRRSTGVATLTGHEADEETSRNTSFNEVPLVTDRGTADRHQEDAQNQSDQHPTPSMLNGRYPTSISSSSALPSNNCDERKTTTSHADPVSQFHHQQPKHGGSKAHHKTPIDDVIAAETSVERLRINDGTSNTSSFKSNECTSISSSRHSSSSDFVKNITARPFEAKRGILKTTSRPTVPSKPEIPTGTSSSNSLTQIQRSNEEIRLQARVAELERLLDSERRENAVMKRFLSDRDSKIRELELHIATLNEDLDLADEDYLRLEEENRALARALSQIHAE